MKMSRLALCAFVFAAACQEQQLPPSARFRGPTDAVLAGVSHRNIFLSGGVRDALYVMDTGDSLSSTSFGVFVRAPNKFFPLEIPVGHLPSALVASASKAHVLIAYAGEGAVGLLSADAQQLVVNADGTDHKVKVGAGPSAILRAPDRDRFYVANAVDGSVSVIDFVEEGVPTMSLVRTIENVGSITRAVLSEDGKVLFGADASSNFVHRVDLEAGTSIDFDVGGPSLDVAVAPNGPATRLYVARADLLSVAVYDASSGTHIDTNPSFAPLGTEPFRDIYIGDVPGRLAFTRQFPTEVYCSDGVDPIFINAYITVATDSGEIYFISTEDNTLVARSFCQSPGLAANPANLLARTDDASAIAPFEPCAGSRRRDECLKLGDDNTGIIASPGNTLETRIRLTYEGVLPFAARDNGGGTLNTDGVSLRDNGSRLNEAPISVDLQDRLVILTAPLSSVEGCTALYGDASSVELREFTVTSVIDDGAGGKGLAFVPAIRPECFPNDEGSLSYVVRASKSFLLTSQVTGQPAFYQGRFVDGQTYGGPFDPIRFTLKDNISSQGVRDTVWEFLVSSPFTPLIRGRVAQQDSSGATVLTPAGRIPTSIMFLDFPGTEQLATLVTFGGNDVVIAYNTRGISSLRSVSGAEDDAIVLR